MALIAVLLLMVPDESDLFPAHPWTESDMALQEEVEQLLARPIDLNRASVEELLAIPWLDPFLAHVIVRTRDSLGGFADPSGLRTVPGVTEDVVRSLAEVVTIRARTRAWTASLLSRSSADSLPGSAHRPGLFSRVSVNSGPWQAAGIVEKDQREPDWFDFVGGGLQFRSSRLRVVLGDLVLGTGRGLVLSSVGRRSGSWLSDQAWAKGRLGLPVSANEGSGLRGLGLEVGSGRLSGSGWAAASNRDARLDADGAVEDITTGGRHLDSASRAEKGTLTEYSAGGVIHGRWQKVMFGASVVHVRYSRPIAPRDSARAFSGRALSVGGMSAEWLTHGYAVGLELAGSSSRGAAGALEVSGNWRGVTTGLNLRRRGPGFFSPHGRWSSMTTSRERLDGSVRFGYRAGGFGANLRGSTYRDFEFDSLPARLAADLGQRIGRFGAGLELGRVFRAGEGRYRSSRLRVEAEPGRDSRVVVTIADERPESKPGRGLALGLMTTVRRRRFSGGLSAARFVITGSGITMSTAEPGAMRAGGSYRTDRSGWRAAASAGVGFAGYGRLGLKVGCTWSAGPNLDAAAQLELAAKGD
ncbi:helix-hairpin-helix domain-containing protein [candidate division WOR-3 bacterium]|nr:helix-hairpin-helix domain-containing protein [candidate division WOR-3 bacterium]